MDYYFYKHSLKYNKILNELNHLFTNVNNQISEPEFITSSYCDHILNESSPKHYPEFVTSSYCDQILNQSSPKHYPEFVTAGYLNDTEESSQESYPEFVTAGYLNDTEESSQESYPEFVTNYDNNIEESFNIEPLQIPPVFVTEYYTEDNIDEILHFDPNHNYNYDESEKLYGDFDDWEDYIDSIYN